MTTKIAHLGAAIGLLGGSLALVQNVNAATLEEFHAQRFGQGGWTYKEMHQLQRDNTRSIDLSKYAKKQPGGGRTWEDVPPEVMYKDPVLGVQLGKAFYEAYQWRKANNIDSKYSGLGMTAGEGAMTHELKNKSDRLDNAKAKINAKGTPTTSHGRYAQHTEQMIEYGQVGDICGSDNGENVEAIADSTFMPCQATTDGSRRLRSKNSITDIKGNGRGSTTYSRNDENFADQFAIDDVRNEGDVYNIDNQDGGEVNVHARGSDINIKN